MRRLKKLEQKLDRDYRNDLNINFELIEAEENRLQGEFNNAVETVSDRAFEKVVDSARINWLPPVNTFDDLATTYPDALEGKTSMVRDSGKVYRMTDGEWREIQDIDPTALNELDNRFTAQFIQTTKRFEDAWIDPVRQFGANGKGEKDDTRALQDALDYANTIPMSERPTIFLGHGIYNVADIEIPRGIEFIGNTVFKVLGEGSVGLRYLYSLYNRTEGIKIQLTERGQTGILVDSVEGQTGTQLNTWRNVWVEGDDLPDTLALKIGKTWVNSFYDCKFFRASDGIEFAHADSNANKFFGCEVRHIKDSLNSKMAILHRAGKTNSFIGGAIETFEDGIDVRSGTLVLDGVYIEDIRKDRGIHLSGDGILKITGGTLVKTKARIRGGKSLTITESVLNQGGFLANDNNSPLVRFDQDVNTDILMEKNDIPSDLIHARWGQWYDESTRTWKNRSVMNKHEKYLDRSQPYLGYIQGASNVTGDGTRYSIKMGDLIRSNPYRELNGQTGIFAPVGNGLFKVNVSLRIENIGNAHEICTLIVRERGAGAREYVVASQNANNAVNNRVLLSGELTIDLQNLLDLQFVVSVSGSSKTVGIMATSDESIHSSFSIQRIA